MNPPSFSCYNLRFNRFYGRSIPVPWYFSILDSYSRSLFINFPFFGYQVQIFWKFEDSSFWIHHYLKQTLSFSFGISLIMRLVTGVSVFVSPFLHSFSSVPRFLNPFPWYWCTATKEDFIFGQVSSTRVLHSNSPANGWILHHFPVTT